MAWLSVGSTNDDLCNQLKQHGVLQTGAIFAAFRHTDRGDFVQQNKRVQAYADRPFKHEYVHISAPHMYATVLEQLDLKPGMSFLNIGSGSGYFSCLVACLLGENGLSHGIDINGEVVKHSQDCCQRWFDNIHLQREAGESDLPLISREGVSFVEGNCFNIDVAASTACCRYDRIYIGAGCPESKKDYFFSLLSDDGIMVAPIDDSNCLISIKRQCRNVYTVTHISHVHFAPLIRQSVDEITDMVHLPPVLWAPVASRHRQFPQQFKEAVYVLLLASRHSSSESSLSGGSSQVESKKYIYRSFPLHIWTFILSFTSRDWFVPVQSESELLTRELFCERRLRTSAEAQLALAITAREKAERERDTFMLVVRQMYPRQYVTSASHLLGISNFLPHTNLPAVDDEEDDDDDGEDDGFVDEEEEEEEEYMYEGEDEDAFEGGTGFEDYQSENEEEGEDGEEEEDDDEIDGDEDNSMVSESFIHEVDSELMQEV
eukprot:CAMPEP_0119038168 /NCGR_PEP_ID=MMETSP1177-20130426/6891_1 /TAXON_ID=2985 /ORGANISM="Ochromonas sp, Strain CCMP1899" /LENGTH=488 /DNA_ID=CAMNT_0007000351 /DNA_START=323 /DNA_END=1789 /DNA_ORIENTATION=-